MSGKRGFGNLQSSLNVPTVGFQKFMFVYCLPDRGALNSCMHTFPEANVGFIRVLHITLCIWTWDLRPSIIVVRLEIVRTDGNPSP